MARRQLHVITPGKYGVPDTPLRRYYPTCFPFSTLFEYHVQKPQSKTRKVRAIPIQQGSYKKPALADQEETKGKLWETNLFFIMAKAIRESLSIPLCPLFQENGVSLSQYLAKASLFLQENQAPHLTIRQLATLQTCWPNWTLDTGYSWGHKHGPLYRCFKPL